MKKGAGGNEAGGTKLVIGVDFDNTIAEYDELMHAIALQRGLIGKETAKSKKLIRDTIRALPDGESHWRGLQVTAYGPRMSEARLIDGVREFFLECRRRGVPVYIVSHKTEFANFGDGNVNLRQAATEWLEQQGFFDQSGIGLSRDRVFFETTRAEKIERMRLLGATHFVDDLEETFGEKSFPAGVEKVLFSSHGEPTGISDAISLRTWPEIHERILGAMDLEVLSALVGSQVLAISRIGRGGNSKVYRVDCERGESYAAKFYFQRTMDGLDRLEVEYSSLEFLWNHGERSVPRPIAVDRDSQIAVYEFVEGTVIDSSSAGPEEIRGMVAFARRLKKLSESPDAEKLHRAAEACFSFDELAANIEGRIARLESSRGETPSYAAFGEFLHKELRPAFAAAVQRVRESVGDGGMSRLLDKAERTLSASDFGFHNALRRSDGSLLILDLEYFGWDDPVKLAADFVLHPAMSLESGEKEAYLSGMLDVFGGDDGFASRLELAYPLFAIKWCTILLNEFVPDFLQRREFALRGSTDREDVRFRQLEKAKRMLAAASHRLDCHSLQNSAQISTLANVPGNAR